MKRYYYSFIFIIIALVSCGKEFLDAKPDLALVVPHTVKDLQAILDNTVIMNNNTPFLGELSAGDNDIQPNRYQTIQVQERNAFIWAKEVYETSLVNDWDWSYRRIFYANQALEGLARISEDKKGDAEYELAKGSALFFRALTFNQLAQQFCKPYIQSSASSDLGIPLRLESNINVKTTRATVKQTYDQIIGDAKLAARYLPSSAHVKTRPSRQAAFALLSATFLQMQDYQNARLYADSCLAIGAGLTDYNSVKPAGAFTFQQFSPEVMFHSSILHGHGFNVANLDVSKELYQQYGANDLRKSLFFKVTGSVINYIGSYTGAREFFGGFALNEMYLIQAECLARSGNRAEALKYLNTLLAKRWKTGTFTPLTASTDEDALKLVLTERRKELVFTGRRWSDLRRLNQDPKFAVTLSRTIGTIVYTLTPNSPLYVLPIPQDVIAMSAVEQNPR
ncbi:MAG: RagB/SusD family nutrient uptake outer membrane protein [Bacteroidota bacterium]